MKEYAAIIVGGGASGMFCALRLAESGVKDVLLLERNDRLGRKLSATGNGQGNVTNTAMSAEHYFSGDAGRVASVLARFGAEDLIGALSALGGIFLSDAVGRVYPASRQAASVTDLLRFALEGRVEVRTGVRVLSARRDGALFSVRTDGGKEFRGRALVLACGGKAAPHFGTDGSGYGLARAFGHTVTPLRPSLVQLKTEQTYIRGLKGVRADCAVRLLPGAAAAKGMPASRGDVCLRGDLLFTDYGVSGDVIFRLSAFCREGDVLSVDFLPDCAPSAVAAAIRGKAERYPQMRGEDLLRGIVNSAVGKCLAKYSANAPFSQDRGLADRLAACVKDFRLPVVGSLGFDYAQVTKGGVPLGEVDDDLMSRRAEGLYLLGELLDVDGECGGYNLQWAFSCGAVAAAAVAGREYAHR
ncbi:MAG TPA: aminoacetone oxidase family FAD-binding enzyme [Candidatus Borkfalkia faecigallinarum]|uniref:Aminoacetone oxidase family FAD-binding enzyme n=1 Tax=Candidatus Borkfalkia faecigallinarum TaxID=2838509 RepID=A0A9D2AS37_9FIRM|nr:aminoacetone oxidase family FAD-binding enzyme [Candidatus Borkfalkia faecigallinarum]